MAQCIHRSNASYPKLLLKRGLFTRRLRLVHNYHRECSITRYLCLSHIAGTSINPLTALLENRGVQVSGNVVDAQYLQRGDDNVLMALCDVRGCPNNPLFRHWWPRSTVAASPAMYKLRRTRYSSPFQGKKNK